MYYLIWSSVGRQSRENLKQINKLCLVSIFQGQFRYNYYVAFALIKNVQNKLLWIEFNRKLTECPFCPTKVPYWYQHFENFANTKLFVKIIVHKLYKYVLKGPRKESLANIRREYNEKMVYALVWPISRLPLSTVISYLEMFFLQLL